MKLADLSGWVSHNCSTDHWPPESFSQFPLSTPWRGRHAKDKVTFKGNTTDCSRQLQNHTKQEYRNIQNITTTGKRKLESCFEKKTRVIFWRDNYVSLEQKSPSCCFSSFQQPVSVASCRPQGSFCFNQLVPIHYVRWEVQCGPPQVRSKLENIPPSNYG